MVLNAQLQKEYMLLIRRGKAGLQEIRPDVGNIDFDSLAFLVSDVQIYRGGNFEELFVISKKSER